jgi:hypothetical protein
VLDAKWKSKRWHASMPETDSELPMPELGVILGVSDSTKFEQALEGYRIATNKLLAKARGQIPAGAIPGADFDFEIPKPKFEKDGGNTYAYYPIPAEWGLDRQFQPTGGLSKRVAVLTLSREHAERLLNETPLQTGSRVLADTGRPLDSAFYLNWAGMVDAASPWVQFLIRSGLVPAEGERTEQISGKVMQLLKVFRSYSSVTYREGKATVTHSEAIFGDVEMGSNK